MRCSPADLWMIVLGCLSIRIVTIDGGGGTIGPDEACIDFAAGNDPRSAWTLADCTDVWIQFVDTIPSGLQKRLSYVDDWRETATALRRAGSPCLSASHGGGDGLGSTTMRILASWIFSREMGCDWVTPDWGRRHVNGGNGTVLYCHPTATREEIALRSPAAPTLQVENHCSVVDWLDYFQFRVPSVRLPDEANIKLIEVGPKSLEEFEAARLAINEDGFRDEGWDRVMFQYDASFASRHLAAVGNWDEDRRQLVRTIIGQARQNFHVHPRPWYDEHPECAYDPGRLNFAIHVRMGDRRSIIGENKMYFPLLELFIDTVSEEVVRKGLEPPLFHVFSETLIPCPSEDTGLFDEFPSWPVHQVPGCLNAEVPDHCPEKRVHRSCNPERSGMFDVIGMPVVLHVSPDVHNAMSCMIQADGVLMGCSTFGQLAGIFSKGISFFSMHCSGPRTPAQYKTIPPLAVAERGHLWVPVAGSWHNPVLNSTELLSSTLDALLEEKDAPLR